MSIHLVLFGGILLGEFVCFGEPCPACEEVNFMTRVIAALLCLVGVFCAPLKAEEEAGAIYYKVVVDASASSYSDSQVHAVVKRCLDRNLVSGLYRSFNEEAPLRAVVMLNLMEIFDLQGSSMGSVYASHCSVRTYPTIIDDLMPEKVGVAVTGDRFSLTFLETFIDGEIAAVFGEFDQIREAIVRYENGE